MIAGGTEAYYPSSVAGFQYESTVTGMMNRKGHAL